MARTSTLSTAGTSSSTTTGEFQTSELLHHDPLTTSCSIHGHDKSIEIRKYSSLPNRPTMFYAGDGVSDLSAAKETDLLFAKADKGKAHFLP